MADLNNQLVTQIVNDDRPIALRRKRRRDVELATNSKSAHSQPKAQTVFGLSTPPETPKRTAKRVRFSDPGPEIQIPSSSSGLTPLIRRSSLVTPTSTRRRRNSSPLQKCAGCDVPLSGTLHFTPLRQMLDGRTKRRLRRNGLSEEMNIIDEDKRRDEKARKTEVERLRQELAAKNQALQALIDEGNDATQVESEVTLVGSVNTGTDQSRVIRELEQEVSDLRSKLQREAAAPSGSPNWTIAAKDPFNTEDDNDGYTIGNYDDYLGDGDEMVTTPTRFNIPFQSPLATAPNIPSRSIPCANVGVQVSLAIPDPETDMLRLKLNALQAEISNLTSAIMFKEDSDSRLAEKLSEFLPAGESCDWRALDSALDTVLTDLALSKSSAQENLIAFSALSSEITGLGFSSEGPEKTLAAIATQFRKARLDLEYLTPGEIEEGFENHKLLDMLVSRVRVLLAKIKEQDSTIDEYHEQELLLREQLNTRISIADSLHIELSDANRDIDELKREMEDKDTSHQRLKDALEVYRTEVAGLEMLIETMETEGRDHDVQLRSEAEEAQKKLHDEALKQQGKDMVIKELELKLASSLQARSKMEAELAAHTSTNNSILADKDAFIERLKSTAQQRGKEHGRSLALRDARVYEVVDEVGRVSEALKAAHATIHDLKSQAESGKKLSVDMVDTMARMLDTGRGNSHNFTSAIASSRRAGSAPVEGEFSSMTHDQGQPVVRKAGLFDADLARRRSGKKRRRYDSGLGFLEEEDEAAVWGLEI